MWVRQLPKTAITEHPKFRPFKDDIPSFLARSYPLSEGSICLLTGVRAQESLRRFRVVMTKKHRNYITVNAEDRNVWTAHPIYDMSSVDIWKAIADNNWDYNRYYDVLNHTSLNNRLLAQRLCAPVGEEALRTIWMFKHIDFDLYNKMLKRIDGVGTAVRYSNTPMYAIKMVSPPDGLTWQQHALNTIQSYAYETKVVVSERVNTLIKKHYRQSLLEITDSTPDPITGCDWKFLCKIAVRGDFKKRTGAMMSAQSTRTLKAMSITLEQAIATYGTEQYKQLKRRKV